MANDLVLQDSGYLVQSDSKQIFLANAELVNVGCMNCVWRMHGQCPHNLDEGDCYNPSELVNVTNSTDIKIEKPKESVPICPEMIQFIVSLAEKDDSVTALWEKFLIYKLRIQESEDYKDYMRLRNEIKVAREKGNLSPEQMDNLSMKETSAKLWWTKLSQHAIVSHQKVVDREAKRDVGKKGAGIFSAKTINFNNVKQIEKKE